jgi:hypothetical protein
MEHSELVTIAEVTMRELCKANGRVSGDDVREKLAREHPTADVKRIKRAVDTAWKRADRDCGISDKAEEEALWEQQKAHMETLPREEALEYARKLEDEARLKLMQSAVRCYRTQIMGRIMGLNLVKGPQTKLGDVVAHLGVEGFVKAARAEMEKDASGSVVVIGNDKWWEFPAPIEDMLIYFGKVAKMCR